MFASFRARSVEIETLTDDGPRAEAGGTRTAGTATRPR